MRIVKATKQQATRIWHLFYQKPKIGKAFRGRCGRVTLDKESRKHEH